MEIVATYNLPTARPSRFVLVRLADNGARCWATFRQPIVNNKPREVHTGRYFENKHDAFANFIDRVRAFDARVR